MAYVKIIDNKHSPKVTINYIKNLEKTTEELIYTNSIPGYEHMHFMATKERWNKTKGINHHHLVQSFSPGEITPDAALRLAKELAEEKLNGFEYVIAVHIDEAHIHSHIVFNSVNYETGRKFSRNTKKLQEVRDYSDYQCLRDGYSIIDNKELKDGMSYKEWLEVNHGTSWKQQIRDIMDSVIEYENVVDYESFKEELQNHSIEIKDKTSTGEDLKWVSYKLKGMERYARDRSLGYEYYKKNIEARIDYKIRNNNRAINVTNYSKNQFRSKPGYKKYYPRRRVYLIDAIIELINTVIKARTTSKIVKNYKNVDYFNRKIADLNELLKFMDNNDIKNMHDLNSKVNRHEEELRQFYTKLKDLENAFNYYPSEELRQGVNEIKGKISTTYEEIKVTNTHKKVLRDIDKSNRYKEKELKEVKEI